MKPRITAYVADHLAEALDVLAARPGLSKSEVIEAALEAFMGGEGAAPSDAVFVRRLDHMSGQLAILERDLAVLREVLALFVRYTLMVTPELDVEQRAERNRLGKERFTVFVDQVAKRVAGGGNLTADVLDAMAEEGDDG